MTTLTMTMCFEHTPHISAISSVGDVEYTFCELCEMNIERFWVFDDYDRLPYATEWEMSV